MPAATGENYYPPQYGPAADRRALFSPPTVDQHTPYPADAAAAESKVVKPANPLHVLALVLILTAGVMATAVVCGLAVRLFRYTAGV